MTPIQQLHYYLKERPTLKGYLISQAHDSILTYNPDVDWMVSMDIWEENDFEITSDNKALSLDDGEDNGVFITQHINPSEFEMKPKVILIKGIGQFFVYFY